MPRCVIHASFQIPAPYVEETKELFKGLMRDTLSTPGCEYYVVTTSATDPTQFRVFEIFTTEEAFEEYSKTARLRFAPLAQRAMGEGHAAPASDVQKHVLIEDVEKGIVS